MTTLMGIFRNIYHVNVYYAVVSCRIYAAHLCVCVQLAASYCSSVQSRPLFPLLLCLSAIYTCTTELQSIVCVLHEQPTKYLEC